MARAANAYPKAMVRMVTEMTDLLVTGVFVSISKGLRSSKCWTRDITILLIQERIPSPIERSLFQRLEFAIEGQSHITGGSPRDLESGLYDYRLNETDEAIILVAILAVTTKGVKQDDATGEMTDAEEYVIGEHDGFLITGDFAYPSRPKIGKWSSSPVEFFTAGVWKSKNAVAVFSGTTKT